jgi:hypothetical protein
MYQKTYFDDDLMLGVAKQNNEMVRKKFKLKVVGVLKALPFTVLL